MTDTPDPDKPITAARGFCAPPDPQWGLPDFMTSSRPVGRALGALPRLSPTRGAIRFLIPPWPWELPDRGFGTYHDERISTGFRIPKKGVLLSLGPVADKYRFEREARILLARGLELFATPGTADVLRAQGVPCTVAWKDSDDRAPSAVELIKQGAIDLVINIPRSYD